MNIAIITARGGSKRIPRKNIREFLGRPIIAYSIEAALNSKLFDEVMVSTDDEEIASLAKKNGANVPFFRSMENSNDFAGTSDVILEVLNEYKKIGKYFELACCIYPTAPFVQPSLLLKAFKKLQASNFDCVFPVIRNSFPIQRALRFNQSELIEMVNPEYLEYRSQDLETTFRDSGQFYIFKVNPFLEKRQLYTLKTTAIILSEIMAQDIDNEDDWKIAELKYRILNGQQ